YPKLTPSGSPSQTFNTAKMPAPIEAEQGRSIWGPVGYVMAAIVALAAGAWFAIHLSSGKEVAVAPSPVGVASPVAASVSPTVMLANAMPVQVSGPGATSADRSTD